MPWKNLKILFSERDLCPIHHSKTCLVKSGLTEWKISDRKLNGVQVITGLYFRYTTFEVDKLQCKQLPRRNNFRPCFKKKNSFETFLSCSVNGALVVKLLLETQMSVDIKIFSPTVQYSTVNSAQYTQCFHLVSSTSCWTIWDKKKQYEMNNSKIKWREREEYLRL